jgi:ketosteroid isomerase-like protein
MKRRIRSLVDLETRSWDIQDPDLLLSVIHPDMVWVWPPDARAHDPADWVVGMGRFNRTRWRKSWQGLFDTHVLAHNRRRVVRIRVSKELDGAFAVVDIDTLWRHRRTGKEQHWKGRVCKIYTKMKGGKWKLIGHTGALEYPVKKTNMCSV